MGEAALGAGRLGGARPAEGPESMFACTVATNPVDGTELSDVNTIVIAAPEDVTALGITEPLSTLKEADAVPAPSYTFTKS